MSNLHAAAQQALDALIAQQTATKVVPTGPGNQVQSAIDSLREEMADLDMHQQLIDSLPDHDDDKMFLQIEKYQRESYLRSQAQVRGQQISRVDSPDAHLIWATLRWIKENQRNKEIVSGDNRAKQSPLTLSQIEELAHRRATKYHHSSDPNKRTYLFSRHTLNDFVSDIERRHKIGA